MLPFTSLLFRVEQLPLVVIYETCPSLCQKYQYFRGMFAWLATANPHLKGQCAKTEPPGLPDPNSSTSAEETFAAFEGANKAADDLVFSGNLKNKKRGQYSDYSDDEQGKTAKYAAMFGTKSAEHFSVELGHRMRACQFKAFRGSS